MIAASKEFKEKLKNGTSLVNYADIVLSNGIVLHLTYKDFMIGGCQIEDKTTDGKFGVGYAIGKTVTIKIANHDERFSQYDFYNSVIHLYVALPLDEGTIEKIKKGVYYATVPATTGNIIEINAVDAMFLLDKDYAQSRTVYPATLQSIVSDVCLDCGIPVGFTQFDNMSFVINEKPENTTFRKVLSCAAQIAGYNARIDNAGYMQLVWYKTGLLNNYIYDGGGFKTYSHDNVIDGGNFADYNAGTIVSGGTFTDEVPEHIYQIKSLDVHTDDVRITGIRVVGQDEVTALFGEEGYLIEVKGNPFVNGKEQQIADYLGKRMVGMVFRPFTAQILNNPLYEPFEVVRVSDRKGNVYNSIINSVSYKIGGYTQVACEAEDPVRNGSSYISASAQAVAEARRNTGKQLTIYDKAVQNMNQLAANAMGLFRESEQQTDGGYIYYQSNKPITVDEEGKCRFEENSVIYKSAAEGFFVSTDGGASFTSGFDAYGNAVVNVLSAIGITFDWAHGGTLTLGGDNDINGEMVVYDAEGNVVGRFNKDGLWASNGYFEGTVKSKNAEITGGYINIETDDETRDTILIKYGSYFTNIVPAGINVSNKSYVTSQGMHVTTIFSADVNTASGYHVSADGLSVSGAGLRITAGGINIASGGLEVSGGLNVKTGGIYVDGGNITAASTSKVQILNSGSDALNVTGGALISGKATLSGGAEVSKGLTVNGGATVASGLTVSTGDLKMSSSIATFTSEGNTVLKKSLEVSGTATFNGSVKIGGSTSSLVGFFNASGSSKKTVANITTPSSATASDIATKLNSLLTALRSYGLIG